jgi:hypothetical protein
MLYTELTQKAMQICFEAHRDQADKGGMPYVFHPFHLAEQMETEDETCAALLHDVVEDTAWTHEQLAACGFSPAVMEALQLLTHDDRVPYLDYVEALSGNRIAARVKLADLRHNSTPGRLKAIGERERRRMRKYLRAQAILTGAEPDLEALTLDFRYEIPALDRTDIPGAAGGQQACLHKILAADGHVLRYTLLLSAEGKERNYEDRFSLLRDLEMQGYSTAHAMSCL